MEASTVAKRLLGGGCGVEAPPPSPRRAWFLLI